MTTPMDAWTIYSRLTELSKKVYLCCGIRCMLYLQVRTDICIQVVQEAAKSKKNSVLSWKPVYVNLACKLYSLVAEPDEVHMYSVTRCMHLAQLWTYAQFIVTALCSTLRIHNCRVNCILIDQFQASPGGSTCKSL